jgi:hypothetical protein
MGLAGWRLPHFHRLDRISLDHLLEHLLALQYPHPLVHIPWLIMAIRHQQFLQRLQQQQSQRTMRYTFPLYPH